MMKITSFLFLVLAGASIGAASVLDTVTTLATNILGSSTSTVPVVGTPQPIGTATGGVAPAASNPLSGVTLIVTNLAPGTDGVMTTVGGVTSNLPGTPGTSGALNTATTALSGATGVASGAGGLTSSLPSTPDTSSTLGTATTALAGATNVASGAGGLTSSLPSTSGVVPNTSGVVPSTGV